MDADYRAMVDRQRVRGPLLRDGKVTNWRWSLDGYVGDVQPTTHPENQLDVFETFGEARKALADHLDAQAKQYREAARSARRLRKPEVSR